MRSLLVFVIATALRSRLAFAIATTLRPRLVFVIAAALSMPSWAGGGQSQPVSHSQPSSQSQPVRPPDPQPSPARWGAFAAFPGARRLCQSHVTGAGEAAGHINWALYATDRPPADVRAFYAAHPGRGKPEPPAEVQIRIGQAILSAYPAADKTYPRCGVDPKATDKTVIVVSDMTAATRMK